MRGAGALPRFRRRFAMARQVRGRGEQGNFCWALASTEWDAKAGNLRRRACKSVSRCPSSIGAIQSVEKGQAYVTIALCSPRPRTCRAIAKRRRKRGSAPRLRARRNRERSNLSLELFDLIGLRLSGLLVRSVQWDRRRFTR